jgi:hypothetical protein
MIAPKRFIPPKPPFFLKKKRRKKKEAKPIYSMKIDHRCIAEEKTRGWVFVVDEVLLARG